MRGFEPKDFADYHTYNTHRSNLERAQRTAKSIFDLWTSTTGLFPKDTGCYYEIMSLLDDAVQIGYEKAIGLPHKASDYDIDEVTVGGYDHACDFCKHQYFVYGCEEACALTSKGLPCRLEVRECIE